jgi:copper homeostasis protein
LGCHGIVCGVLTSDKKIDLRATEKLIDASGSMDFIFHRAIDLVKDPISAIEDLNKLNITGVLSSGQKSRAIDGLPLLEKMRSASDGTFEIMPGGGIRLNDIVLFKKSGFKSIHLSAIRKKEQVNTGTSFFDNRYEGISDPELIKDIVCRSKRAL